MEWKMTKHYELIKCHECKKPQKALVKHSIPWWTYIYECECDNWIVEPSRDEIKDDELGIFIDLLVP